MGYVDIREREGLARNRQRMSVRQEVRHNPYFSILAGVFSVLTGLILSISGALLPPDDSWLMLWIPAVYIIAAVFALRAARQQLRQGRSRVARPQPGAEKQLLLALRDSGGLTVVEAALETSLTVDEAEEILSRLADRGHLIVQSHDGALFYTLPGRRPGALGENQAPQF